MKIDKRECISYIAEDGTRFDSEYECRKRDSYLTLPKVYLIIERFDDSLYMERLIKIVSSKEKAEIEASGHNRYVVIDERVVE